MVNAQMGKLNNDATAYELSANYRINDKSRVYIRTESNFRFAKVSEQSYTFPGVVGLTANWYI